MTGDPVVSGVASTLVFVGILVACFYAARWLDERRDSQNRIVQLLRKHGL